MLAKRLNRKPISKFKYTWFFNLEMFDRVRHSILAGKDQSVEYVKLYRGLF